MSSDVHRAEAHTDSEPGVSVPTIVFGVILLVLGGLWLLDASEVINVTWTLVGSVILILLGAVLIGAARRSSHGGMIFVGVVLSGVVLLGSLASWPSFEGGVGDSAITPTSFSDIDDEYAWGVGNQEIDLSQVEFPEGDTTLPVSLGTGNLEVTIPSEVGYRVEWSVGLGNADIFEQNHTGFSLDGAYQSDDFDDAGTRLVMEVELGMGSLEVRE